MLIVLLTLLGGVALLLAVPVDIEFSVRRGAGLRPQATLAWLYGLVRVPLRAVRETREPPPVSEPVRRGPRRQRRWSALLRKPGAVGHLLGLLRRLLDCVRVRYLRVHLRLGLDDPADTGQLWAVVGPLAWAIPLPSGSDLAIEPDFCGACLALEGEGAVRIVPVAVLLTLLAFIVSLVNWRIPGTGR